MSRSRVEIHEYTDNWVREFAAIGHSLRRGLTDTARRSALLFRDYLRVCAGARAQYERVKRELAAQYPNDMPAYTDAKASIFWEIMEQADRWAANTGWEPGPSDA